MAGLWDDLWQTRDQQAMTALDNGEANEASRLFEHPGWKGSAFYRGENFSDAGNKFATVDGSDARYNLGNSLAKQGRFEEAIEAYTQSLEIQPDHEDATFNKRLIEELLSQQQQQQSEDGEQNESPDQERGDQESQSEQDDSGDEQQAGSDQDEQQSSDEQKEGEQEQSEEEDGEPQNQQMAQEDAKLDAEEQQALQQWLRRVPDDPGGLLRRKFKQQYEDNLRQGNISRNNSDADW
ncbi:MAG: tetratricopeptide repeat protein [Gammaproteobacteria bacterium]|nr:tetratricopeptide repeat protein [Gammaproteobacteria bacterium]